MCVATDSMHRFLSASCVLNLWYFKIDKRKKLSKAHIALYCCPQADNTTTIM